MRLIDADALNGYKFGLISPYAQNLFHKTINEAPTIVQEQRTGHWEYVQYEGNCGNWHCSECRTIIPHMPENTDNTPIYKWCPMCGAKMASPTGVESEGIMNKEIEYAIRILTESIGEGGFINKGTPIYIACKTALASINALEEIRQEAIDAIEDGLYVRNTRILDIIDKHKKGE